MTLQSHGSHLFTAGAAPEPGRLAELLRRFDASWVVGHPTLNNRRTIGSIVRDDLRGAIRYESRRTAIIVSDGTLRRDSPDASVIQTVRDAAHTVFRQGRTPADAALVIAVPHDGYAGDHTIGKGSALRLIYRETAMARAGTLMLADGDLRNDIAAWRGVFQMVEEKHRAQYGRQPFFITARYARHFVDAALTRFIVGPLTTLLGTWVPGGISGDVAMSLDAVEQETRADWTPARRRFGTDIATTIDNVADSQTVIHEVWLGAKLHTLSDEVALDGMPREVIAAALERLRHWEAATGIVTDVLRSARPLRHVVTWGPQDTGIHFIDPGGTSAFDLDARLDQLLRRYEDFAPDIRAILRSYDAEDVDTALDGLRRRERYDDLEPAALGIHPSRWADYLGQGVAYALTHDDPEPAVRGLSYLYLAAWIEFVIGRLHDLGHRTMGSIRRAQEYLAAPADQAESFYARNVDGAARDLAYEFYEHRARILEHVARFEG